MKVFISSLISGFEPFRAAARSAVKSLGHQPIMAEEFGAKPSSPQIACLQGLRDSDLMILLLSGRYGAVPAGSRVSPTHEEYLEARESKQILLFVQEGVNTEPAQAALIADAQGWHGGLFRAGFRNPEELRDQITAAIHNFELAHVAGPVNSQQLLASAEALLSRESRGSAQLGPLLRVSIVGGPQQQVLRPSELESDALAEALQQQAMFGTPRIFDRSMGIEQQLVGDVLMLEQARGAGIRLDEKGSLEVRLPLGRTTGRDRGFGDSTFAIVEETVVAAIANAIGFVDWALDHVDPTQRLTHIAIAARIEASDYMSWRTQAEHNASPNSGTMRMGNVSQQAVCLDKPRVALKFDRKRLAEDLMVPLRRQWKA
jgi:hypothetical protein